MEAGRAPPAWVFFVESLIIDDLSPSPLGGRKLNTQLTRQWWARNETELESQQVSIASLAGTVSLSSPAISGVIVESSL